MDQQNKNNGNKDEYFLELDNIKFEIKIVHHKDTNEIEIFGEHRETSQHYHLMLNEEKVAEVTKNKFDCEQLFFVLKAGLGEPNENTKVLVKQDGIIDIYTQITIQKVIKLQYQLKLLSIELSDKQLIKEQAQRIARLEQIVKQHAKILATLNK